MVLFEVLDLGCKHVCAELFLSAGEVEPPPVQCIIQKRCMDKCGICTGAWSKTFLRVNKDSVVRFLESHHFSKEVPLIARNDNVVGILWKGERWRIEEIYGKKSVNKTVVSALFLQLTATKILELVNTKDGLAWKLGHGEGSTATASGMTSDAIDLFISSTFLRIIN